MIITKTPGNELALTNCAIVSARDFNPQIRYIIVERQFVFTIKPINEMPQGQIGVSNIQRQWAMLSLNQDVHVAVYDPFSDMNCYLSNVNIQVSYVRKGVAAEETFDGDDMTKTLLQSFNGLMLAVGQKIVFDYHGFNFMGAVMSAETVDFKTIQGGQAAGAPAAAAGQGFRGILMDQTNINLQKSPDSNIKLKGGSKSHATALIQPNFKFEDMGIGGLDKEFSQIFRRAFASRIFPPHIVEKLGIQHVKGMILYGPPGTGKTLIARQIGKMLNAKEPKIVNGPEILNKYVGASEENIRKLFADAEAEYKARGEESSLHIIIFDELDAICKQRGSKNDGTGVGDSVVNQLLSKMDGVDPLNNILVIGMTNRLDMIDEALLRPGRLEIKMEISLPDEEGRVQILNVHTAK
ncbi:transport between ER and Golgi ATPase protein, partial [Podochytrium sp. JEL0797]